MGRGSARAFPYAAEPLLLPYAADPLLHHQDLLLPYAAEPLLEANHRPQTANDVSIKRK